MKRFVPRILPVVMCLLVVLTGQGLAVSRGVDRAVGQMVLCTGTGPVVVYMDEDGQPTAPPHYCPDYALALLGAVHPHPPVVPDAPLMGGVQPLSRDENLIALPLPRKPARAPPVTV
jgi:hypothetical protein